MSKLLKISKKLFNQNYNLVFFISLYLFFVCISFITSNYLIIWGENQFSYNPSLNLQELLNSFNFNDSIFTSVENLPRGYHTGIISSILSFSIYFIANLLNINSPFYSIFFSFCLMYLTVKKFYFVFNKRINPTHIYLLSLSLGSFSQSVDYLFSGMMPSVYQGFFLYSCAIIYKRLVIGEENFLERFIFILSFLIAFYLGPQHYLVYALGIIFIHLFAFIKIKKFFKIKLFFDYFIIGLFCLFFIIEYLIHPTPNLPFNKTSFLMLLSAGLIKPEIFSKLTYILLFLISLIIWTPLINKKLNLKIKKFFIFIIIFILIIGSTKFLFFFKDYIFIFDSFRSGWRLSTLTYLLIIILYTWQISDNQKIIKLCKYIIIFNLFALSLNFSSKLTLNQIPQEYFTTASYLNLHNDKKIILPISKKYSDIFSNYDFFKKPKKKHTYYSSIFGFLVPIRNLVDLDFSDHYSREKFQNLRIINYENNKSKKLMENCINKIIVDKKKQGYDFELIELNQYYKLVKSNYYLDVYELKNLYKKQHNCERDSQSFKYNNYLKKIYFKGTFNRNNKKFFDYSHVYEPKFLKLIAHQNIFQNQVFQSGKLKRKRCLHFWTKGKFITFHQDEYSNIFFEKNNLSKIIPTQVKFQIEKKNYIKNVFLIDKKGIYCFEKSENKSFIFFFNNRIYNYEK